MAVFKRHLFALCVGLPMGCTHGYKNSIRRGGLWGDVFCSMGYTHDY